MLFLCIAVIVPGAYPLNDHHNEPKILLTSV